MIQEPDRSAVSIKVLVTNFVRAATPKHLVRKPIEGTVNINVDVSFCEETLSGLSGAMARDHKGNFISATTWVLPHVRSAESAEPSAIRNGLYLAGRI